MKGLNPTTPRLLPMNFSTGLIIDFYAPLRTLKIPILFTFVVYALRTPQILFTFPFTHYAPPKNIHTFWGVSIYARPNFFVRCCTKTMIRGTVLYKTSGKKLGKTGTKNILIKKQVKKWSKKFLVQAKSLVNVFFSKVRKRFVYAL